MMEHEANSPTYRCSAELLRNLADPEYREGYLEETVRTNVAFQIHAMRSQRGWSQQELADKAGKPANAISRLESPDYGRLSLTTLIEIANAFDVAVLVQFAEWEDWLQRMADVSPAGLQKRSFNLGRLLALDRANQAHAQTPAPLLVDRPSTQPLSGSFPFHSRILPPGNISTISHEENRQTRATDPFSGKPYDKRAFL